MCIFPPSHCHSFSSLFLILLLNIHFQLVLPHILSQASHYFFDFSLSLPLLASQLRTPNSKLSPYPPHSPRLCYLVTFRPSLPHIYMVNMIIIVLFPSTTRRHGNFAGVHTLLRILLSSNSAVLINIITGVSPPHFDFVVFYYVLCQC
jgi:hypothetical protein